MISKLKKNKLLVGVFLTYIFLITFMPDKAVSAGKNSMYYIIEMLEIMPVIFILTSLIETWVPRNVIMNSFGEKAGTKGLLFSFLLGSFSAGPIYAAFPVCKMLLKKGASIVNIVIILSTWAVVKVPMLANEAKFLGGKFMVIRWILTTVSIFVMAYLVSIAVKKEDLPIEDNETDKNNEELKLKERYCVGCGICAKLSPNYFEMDNSKAKIKNNIIIESSIENILKTIQKCPSKAIYIN